MEILYILIIIFTAIIFFYIGKFITKKKDDLKIFNLVKDERKKAIEKSRHILKGQFNEHLSPFKKDFPVRASECRFLGAPIDFICFSGIDEKNVEEIIFIEVKSGNSKLNQNEKSIKKTIENKKVRFIEYRIK